MKPGRSETALGRATAGFGLQYAHLAYLATQDEAMAALVARAERECCCLLCCEADPLECHRLLVAERAAQMNGGTLTPVHLAVAESLTSRSG